MVVFYSKPSRCRQRQAHNTRSLGSKYTVSEDADSCLIKTLNKEGITVDYAQVLHSSDDVQPSSSCKEFEQYVFFFVCCLVKICCLGSAPQKQRK